MLAWSLAAEFSEGLHGEVARLVEARAEAISTPDQGHPDPPRFSECSQSWESALLDHLECPATELPRLLLDAFVQTTPG